jgi:hypothetical protein
MPYVRHELGKRLRLKRIPEFHLELDETVERGTRVLRLLDELESGHVPDEDLPLGESLPTPVPRLPHEGDAEDEPAPATEAEAVAPRLRRPFRTCRNRPVPGKRHR